MPTTTLSTEILVIGGGATGTGVAWDAALRGFRTILVEKRDLTHGTTGRYHGLLHSGGRYVVKDPHSAVECIAARTSPSSESTVYSQFMSRDVGRRGRCEKHQRPFQIVRPRHSSEWNSRAVLGFE